MERGTGNRDRFALWTNTIAGVIGMPVGRRDTPATASTVEATVEARVSCRSRGPCRADGFSSPEFGDSDLAELLELETELAMLLAADDVESIGAALEPGSVAAVLIWENVWAAPFGSAVRRSGGQLVASGRIPIQAIAAAVEAAEATM